jgi:hypothetical protein
MKARPFDVFVYYHLGLDAQFEYRFRNLHDVAAYFGSSADEVQEFLTRHRIDAATFRHIDFNLSAAHVDAQMLDLEGAATEERRAFAERTWERFQAALKGYDPRRTFEDLDYDDPWGDGKS